MSGNPLAPPPEAVEVVSLSPLPALVLDVSERIVAASQPAIDLFAKGGAWRKSQLIRQPELSSSS